MAWRRRWRLALVGASAALLAGGAAALLLWNREPALPPASSPSLGVPLAVMGDSNSHSYQDAIAFPPGSGDRGGPFHDRTFQWTEVLARLRGNALDPGPWETTGRTPGLRLNLRYLLSLPELRAPRKQDYRYNFAYSGAPCRGLMTGRYQQAPRLVAMMNREPERWRHGVVVIRIGMVDLSDPGFLDQLAQDPEAAVGRKAMAACVRDIGQAVQLIRAAHPSTRIVLVGIMDDVNDPNHFARWRSRRALDHIARALDRFDGALRDLAASQPGLSFFDDRAWFREHWGARGAQGEPAYRTVALGERLRVSNSLGDAPTHALLADDHAGLAWNALWAQALVAHLHGVAGVPVAPISDAELGRFVDGLVDPVPVRVPGS